MARFETGLDSIRLSFSRLTQREQVLVLGGSVVTVLIIVFSTGMWLSSSIDRTEHRIKRKTEQLQELFALQGQYKARQSERDKRLEDLSRGKVKMLSTVVEDAARQAGCWDAIGRLQPENGEPGPDGVVESRVDLRVSGLSIDRLQEFLKRLEQSRGIVIVKRLKLNKPYRKDTVDVELTVTTFKVGG